MDHVTKLILLGVMLQLCPVKLLTFVAKASFRHWELVFRVLCGKIHHTHFTPHFLSENAI